MTYQTYRNILINSYDKFGQVLEELMNDEKINPEINNYDDMIDMIKDLIEERFQSIKEVIK